MNKSLRSFSVLTTVGMFLVQLAGALVANAGSADGCGNTWAALEPIFTSCRGISLNVPVFTVHSP
ncbi:hypothetical protein [Thermicanus aegyptius]|uniref:hypothetical protein n=1 Tax=Thermicanus aegyptius TaxID=94009 RepID=UPI001B7FB9F1|nr:hypothetical protein [Thermicanus aegyptius]